LSRAAAGLSLPLMFRNRPFYFTKSEDYSFFNLLSGIEMGLLRTLAEMDSARVRQFFDPVGAFGGNLFVPRVLPGRCGEQES
jgi:hypothetical protein